MQLRRMVCSTRIGLFLGVLFFFQTAVFAQTKEAAMLAGKDSAVVRLFEKPTEIKWIKRFKGRMDDAAVVDLVLAFDGRNCRGYLTYSKSNVRFQLTGVFEDSIRFRLEERDPVKALTGTYVGVYQNRRLTAEWANAGNTLGNHLEAQEMPPGQTLNVNCGDNKWANRYLGRYNEARVDMALVRMHEGRLYGFLWVEADAKTYALEGEMDREGNYEITALLPGEKTAGLLSGNLKSSKATDCNWVGSGERRTFKLVQGQTMPFGCYEYADYRSSYDAVYPRTACNACNTWLDQEMKSWTERCKSTLTTRTEPLSPASRNIHRASAWAEIASWTDNVLCGYLTFTDTWSEQAQGQAFNFDLRTGKPIALEDVFNKGFNAKAWLEEYAKKESPKMPPFAADPKYREWIVKEGFPLFTLRRDGLELSTLFHPQYGRQSLTVPYLLLKPYMKKENPVGEFVK